jgi:hypothetical protein
VVPRAWTIYFAEMAGFEVPDEIPHEWLAQATGESGAPVPDRLSEEAPPARDDVAAVQALVADAKRGAAVPSPKTPRS